MDTAISPDLAHSAVKGFLQGVGFEMTVTDPPLDQIFTAAELDQAITAMDQIMQEFALGKDERRFRQSQMMELLYRRGISPMLAHAAIEDVIARKVFRVGNNTPANLKTTTWFDGQTETEVTPDRYLHTSHDRWFRSGGIRKRLAKKRDGKPLRSWTQTDLDGAIRDYKAHRAASYQELVEGVLRRKPGAIKTARAMFGRNAIAKALAVKARAMVSKSPVWRQMAAALQLLSKARKPRNCVGLAIATDMASLAQGDTTQVDVESRDLVALVRKELPASEAEAVVEDLRQGKKTPDEVYEIVKLFCEQQQDDRTQKLPKKA